MLSALIANRLGRIAYCEAEIGFFLQKEKESMAKNEIYFIKAFVEPLWVNISKLFPSVSPRVNTLHCNLRVYQKMIEPDGAYAVHDANAYLVVKHLIFCMHILAPDVMRRNI